MAADPHCIEAGHLGILEKVAKDRLPEGIDFVEV
jgi:hypothetical protein